ncbi:MAG: dehydrogenase [Shewanella sp.]
MYKVRSKAPLRIGLAGGGTDVSPFSDKYGGCVLNATINMYAYCTLKGNSLGRVTFSANDIGESFSDIAKESYILDGALSLHKAVYNRVIRQFNNNNPLPVDVVTWTDAPVGSGLGTSSTIVVALLSAYREYLNLPLGEYEIASLAYQIERLDCGFSGGKQDQYAATFGGFNFIEFYEDKVIVNPLRIKEATINELEGRLLLYYTGQSRESAKVIDDQIKNVNSKDTKPLDAMFLLKSAAIKMKEALLKSNIDEMISIVRESWEAKKSTSSSISNSYIERIIKCAEDAGVKALKLSGAGGGGFMLMCIEPEDRMKIESALSSFDGFFVNFEFKKCGEVSWKI